MWQSHSQSGAPPSSGKKRKVKRSIHLKRMDVQCELLAAAPDGGAPEGQSVASASEPQKTKIRLVLNDFSTKGAGFFSQIPMQSGQKISLTLKQPKKTEIQGKVIWCQEYNLNSHIIAKDPFIYTVGVEFAIETPEKKQELQEVIQQLKAEYLGQK